MRIISWNIGIVWEDGTEENIGDVPDWVASRVDEFLTELEEEDDEWFNKVGERVRLVGRAKQYVEEQTGWVYQRVR